MLVVADTPANRQMLRRRLERRGFEIAEAEDGRSALAYRQAQACDIVTCREEPEQLVQAMSAGANDYVNKPVNLPVLEARMRTQLSNRWAQLALRVSEERYRVAIAGSNDGIWDWDRQAGSVHYSQRWAAIIGVEPEELTPAVDEWFSRVHPKTSTASSWRSKRRSKGARRISRRSTAYVTPTARSAGC